ncbi:MAG: flagellar protein FliT [Azoarcus sp.]|jgi:transposase|nr:flagellar protein FliT [Azoarcus sp.]
MITPKQNAGTRILNLEEARALLALYESMIEIARARDWERLAEIEHQAAIIRDTASAPAREPADADSTAQENIKALTELIRRIQALDREIRDYVEPAHEEARQQLASEIKGRNMRAAYGGLDSPG